MTGSPMTGRCLCGAVRYRCGPLLCPPTICHCESCRRAAGAANVAWATIAIDTLQFTAAQPVEFKSSPAVHRTFCGRCGTPLTYRRGDRPGEIDVTLATLDRAADIAPADHIWVQDALPWDRPGDGLREYRQGRGRG